MHQIAIPQRKKAFDIAKHSLIQTTCPCALNFFTDVPVHVHAMIGLLAQLLAAADNPAASMLQLFPAQSKQSTSRGTPLLLQRVHSNLQAYGKACARYVAADERFFAQMLFPPMPLISGATLSSADCLEASCQQPFKAQQQDSSAAEESGCLQQRRRQAYHSSHRNVTTAKA